MLPAAQNLLAHADGRPETRRTGEAARRPRPSAPPAHRSQPRRSTAHRAPLPRSNRYRGQRGSCTLCCPGPRCLLSSVPGRKEIEDSDARAEETESGRQSRGGMPPVACPACPPLPEPCPNMPATEKRRALVRRGRCRQRCPAQQEAQAKLRAQKSSATSLFPQAESHRFTRARETAPPAFRPRPAPERIAAQRARPVAARDEWQARRYECLRHARTRQRTQH